MREREGGRVGGERVNKLGYKREERGGSMSRCAVVPVRTYYCCVCVCVCVCVCQGWSGSLKEDVGFVWMVR